MSMYKGAMIAATAAGTGTTRTFTFAKPVGICWFTNNHSTDCYVRVNDTTAAVIAHGGYDIRIPAGTTREICEGRLAISNMAVIWTTSDPSTSYNVSGIPVTQK